MESELPSDRSQEGVGRSLIVKLPYTYCTKCTDATQRWCEPTRPFDRESDWYNSYDHGYAYTTKAGYFLSRLEGKNYAQWLWHISELRSSARTCRCCSFILETLNTSPWLEFEDEDFIVLKSQLVGSKHSGALATPEQRDNYDRQFEYGNRPSRPYSNYDRYHRPMIKLYNKRKERKDDYGTHTAGDVTFILPLTQENQTSLEGSLHPQTFHGRRVGENIDLALIQEWFRTCCKDHVKPSQPVKYPAWEKPSTVDCIPEARRKISHYRLIDVKKRCIVLAKDEDQYAALSYVWGQAKRLLLTAANLQQLSTPGAFSPENEEIPRTFKDALYVAEQLNITFIWIDAVCVLQDNETQLIEHMNVMDAIYSSAILTIVSDTDNADSGIPGISIPRGPPQVIFKHGAKTYISAKRTFGKALSDSCWESRAWCLQEKVFSRRLLIFTNSQAFYHCSSTTWFEDTVMESKERNHGSVYIAERASPTSKGMRQPGHTAYEAHRLQFGRNFWSLTEIYIRRQLSFESDSIRAFAGILASMESEYGPAHWGAPEYVFSRGVTWVQSQFKMENRRPQFPSWSWAGWRGNKGSDITFPNMRADDSDIWNIDWHFHKHQERSEEYDLVPMIRKYKSGWGNVEPVTLRRPKHEAAPKKEPKTVDQKIGEGKESTIFDPLSDSSSWDEDGDWTWEYEHPGGKKGQSDFIWDLPDHPDGEAYIDRDMPVLNYNSETMPPLSHIIRFFTSCAKIFIDAEPDAEYHKQHHPFDKDRYQNFYQYRAPSNMTVLGHIALDAKWEGLGKEHEFVYVSTSFWPPSDSMMSAPPVIIWVMLVEEFEGAPELKKRVQICGPMNISTWRLMEPVWKCVSLA